MRLKSSVWESIAYLQQAQQIVETPKSSSRIVAKFILNSVPLCCARIFRIRGSFVWEHSYGGLQGRPQVLGLIPVGISVD